MHLQIDKKCNQNWNEMKDADSQQKFCDVCSKCVHDLDHYSFKELKTFLNDNPTACVKIKTRNLEQFNSKLQNLFLINLKDGYNFLL